MADKKKKAKQKEEKSKGKKRKRADGATPLAPSAYPVLQGIALPQSAVVDVASGLHPTDTAILDATLACIEQHGMGGLTTRRIAVLAGVNEVTIFRRFGNKETLLQSVFQREAQMMQQAALGYTGALEEDLLRITWVFADLSERRRGVLSLLLSALRTGDATHTAARHFLSALDGVAQVLTQYMQEGRLRTEAPARAAAALIGPIVFDTLVQPVAQDNIPPLDIAAHVQGFLLGRGIERK